MKPLMVDLFSGLGGWTTGALLEGYNCIGFDIERHDYGRGGYPAQLVLQDVTTLHGSQFKDVDLIVASPPCQEFSYMAMPWTRAKEKARKIRESEAEQKRLTALFDACFRIQREACAAAGRKIPMVVENVCGAQKWVGRARWHFGSFYLWGDVPALIPMTSSRKMGWHSQANGMPMRRDDSKNDGGSWFAVAHNTESGKGQNPDGRHISKARRDKHYGDTEKANIDGRKVPGFRFDGSKKSFQQASVDGTKQGGDWLCEPLENCISRRTSSKSNARKAASAEIAKIPLTLSRWIASYYKPAGENPATARKL